jgi:putative transposase
MLYPFELWSHSPLIGEPLLFCNLMHNSGDAFAKLAGMPRKIIPQTSPFPMHVGCRTVNREVFPIPINLAWEIMCDELTYCAYTFDLKILCFVLMPNHFHLIAISETHPIGKAMLHFMKVTALRINQRAKRINHLWGTRYWKTLLTNPTYFFNTYKYVYQNPVRAGLAGHCEEWRYSSLNQLLGFSKLKFPLQEDTILFSEIFNEKELEWLNRPIKKEYLDDIRTALKHSNFKLSKNNGYINVLESIRA